QHQYLDDNPSGTASDSYTINLTLTQNHNVIGTASVQTIVNNVPPVLDTLTIGGPLNVNQATHLTRTYHDLGTQETHQLLVDWDGDNVYDQTVSVSNGSFDVMHTYSVSAAYTVHVRLVDDDTGFATGVASVTVTNPNPLEVMNFAHNNSGFDVTFNKPI